MAITDRKICSCLKSNLLVILTLVGVAIGLIVGIFVRQTNPSQDVVIWIGIPGDVYMGSLKMVVLPLIITSVIAGTASLDPKSSGKISLVTLMYIVVTNSLACIVPMMITLAVQPGSRSDVSEEILTKEGEAPMDTIDIFADLIRNLFPPNIISACFEQTKYEFVAAGNVNISSDTNDTLVDDQGNHVTKVKVLGKVPSTNVLGLVVCSFFFGVAASSMGEKGRPFIAFFHSTNAVMMKVLSWLIWTTPVGVVSLIATAFIKTEHIDSIVKSLGMFSLLTIGFLLLHVAFLAIIIHLIVLRSNPLPFLASLGRSFSVAFGSASNAMAMPEIFHALEDKMNIDSRVTRFTVPLATTINRDGSSIFMAVSCIFLAQMSGHTMNAAQIVILWTLVTFTCMATPAVPSSSIVVISIILSSMGVSTHLVGLLFAAEWILDRTRACVNVASHCFCALIVARVCRNSLPPLKNTLGEDNNTSRTEQRKQSNGGGESIQLVFENGWADEES